MVLNRHARRTARCCWLCFDIECFVSGFLFSKVLAFYGVMPIKKEPAVLQEQVSRMDKIYLISFSRPLLEEA